MYEKLVGFDANALYLWALMQNMPTGAFVRRKAEDNFEPTQSQESRETMDFDDMCPIRQQLPWKNRFRLTCNT